MLRIRAKRLYRSRQWPTSARWAAAIVLAIVACFVVRPRGLQAAEAARVVLVAATDEVVAGEPIPLSLKVIHDRDTRVEIPRLPREWGPFHVDDQTVQITETTADGRLVTQQTIVVSVYAPGSYSTPPIPVTVRRKNGSTVIETVSPIALRSRWGEDAPSCD